MADTAAGGRYDGTLQMFVEAPRDADPARLRFLRWLVESGRLEHRTAGPSTGEFAKLVRFEPKGELPLAG
jgi:hypothetical protein